MENLENLTPSEIQTFLTTGPPYYSPYAVSGGLPNTEVDIPVCAVFLAIYTLLFLIHAGLLVISLKRARHFIISLLTGILCFLRIISCALRIAWSTNNLNIRLAIANQVFVTAGVVILFAVDLIIVQSVFQTSYPGWYARHRSIITIACTLYRLTIPLCVAMVIVVIVQFFYTTDQNIRRIDRDVQKFVAVWFTALASVPLATVIPGIVLPKFFFGVPLTVQLGTDRFKRLLAALLFISALLTFGAAFRTAVLLKSKSILSTAWYLSRACYYCFNFGFEIIVISIMATLRFGKSRVEEEFTNSLDTGAEVGSEETKTETDAQVNFGTRRDWSRFILTEEEIFNDQDPATFKPSSIHL